MTIRRALLALGLIPLIAAPVAALNVTSTTPVRYALHVPGSLTQISVTFDAAPALPATAAVRVSGTMSGLHTGTVQVIGNELTFTTAEAWQPGEMVHVNLRSDVATAGGDELTHGHYFAFTIASGVAPASWPEPTVYPAASVPYFLFGGDLDNDGTPDIAVPNEGTHDVSVWTNPGGDAVLTPRSDYGVGLTPSSIYGDDFDNDGDLDLASADIQSGTVTVLLNQGNGTFAPGVPYAAGGTTRQVHGGDFDGDNDIDLCATSFSSGQIFLYTNQGNGTFDAGVAYTDLAAGPFAICTGDLDLDGWIDIGVACQTADSLTVLINQGGGTFTTTGSYKTGNGPWDLVGNDMDGDGDFDFVTVTAFNSRVQIQQNDGAAAFSRKTVLAGLFPLGVHVADLDGDGDIDAMSANFNAGTVGVYLNDGNAGLVLDATLDVNRSGSYVWAHDLDSDGDLDLSVVDELSDSLYVFLNEPVVGVPNVTAGLTAGPKLTARPSPMRAGGGTTLSLSGVGERATVEVFDVSGQLVTTLHQGPLANGEEVQWDGRGASGQPVAAGVYLVRARGPLGTARTTLPLLR